MVARPASTLVARSWDAVACRLVAEGQPLRVHSLFERALNLQTDTGELLGVVGPRAGNGPATILLDRLPQVGFDRLGLAPGAPATATDTGLRIGTELRIDLRATRLWLPPSTPLAFAPPVALARVDRAERLAGDAAPTGGLAPLLPLLAALVARTGARCPSGLDPLGQAAWAGLSSLLPAWRGGEGEAIGQAASRLVGLGPGLTPSGDDLLAGLLVATDRLGGGIPTAARRACVQAAEGRTTDIAVARLRHAARGAIEEVQENVIASLLGLEDEALPAAVARAARWGHTSGVDTLVGLFLGARLALGARSELIAAGPIVRAEMTPK